MNTLVDRHFDLARLRKGFDRRAEHFVSVDFFLREVAARMQAHLDLIKLAPQRVLDIGCATGSAWSDLQKKYPGAQLFGLDWSRIMLAQACKQSFSHRFWRYLRRQRVPLIQANWSYLPIAFNSIDLIWSNFALHWAALPDQVLAAWTKVLRTDGLLILSTLGPDSLKELRAAFAQVDADIHIPDYVDMHDWGDMLINSGLSDPVVDAETLTITYETPQALLKDVRTLGLYPGTNHQLGLRGRAWQQRLYAALEAQRHTDGLIHLSVELIYAHAWKLSLPLGKPDKDGVARLRPEDIGRQRL